MSVGARSGEHHGGKRHVQTSAQTLYSGSIYIYETFGIEDGGLWWCGLIRVSKRPVFPGHACILRTVWGVRFSF